MSHSPSQSFEAVLFDLDGTLIDSVEDIARSANHVRQKMGMPPLPVRQVRSYIGDGIHSLFERVLQTKTTSRILEAIDLWRPHYLEHCLNHTSLYPKVKEVLESLASHGISLGVVTNKPERPAEAILSGLGVRSFFAVVVGGDTTSHRKPEAGPILHACKSIKVSPNLSLMVGDSPNDILSARNANCPSCAVLWGLTGEKELRAHHPHYLITHPSELKNLVAKK